MHNHIEIIQQGHNMNKAPNEYIEYHVYVGMSSRMYTMYYYEKRNYNYSQITF